MRFHGKGLLILFLLAIGWRSQGATLTGTVRDNLGGPVTNLLVRASAETNSLSAVTDANGRYSLTLTAGVWGLSLDAQRMAVERVVSTNQFPINLSVAENGATRDFTLFRAPDTLRVSLVNEAGAPVNTAQFQVETLVDGNYVSFSQQSTNGQMDFMVFPGDWWVYANTFGQYKPVRPWVAEVRSNLTEVHFVASMYRAGRLTVRIIDESGSPLADFPFAYAGLGVASVRTDANGEFSSGNLRGVYQITSPSQDYLLAKTTLLVLDGITNYATIQAHRAPHAVIARIASPNTNLTATFSTHSGSIVFEVSHKGVGEIRFPAFPGEWTLNVATYYEPILRRTLSVSVTPSTLEQTVDVPLQIPAATATVRGRLVDELGNPWTNRAVSIFAESTVSILTGPDGAFSLPIRGGQWKLYLGAVGRSYFHPYSTLLTVEDGKDLELGTSVDPAPSATLALRLLRSDGAPYQGWRQPEVNYLVYAVVAINGDLPSLSGRPVGDEFIIQGPPGLWEITVEPTVLRMNGFRGAFPFRLNVPAGRTEASVQLERPTVQRMAPEVRVDFDLAGMPRLRLLGDQSFGGLEIEGSTDLVNWRFLPDAYADLPAHTNHPSFFYRAIVVD